MLDEKARRPECFRSCFLEKRSTSIGGLPCEAVAFLRDMVTDHMETLNKETQSAVVILTMIVSCDVYLRAPLWT